ncbi:MAG TPA: peptidoglycan-binding protein [Actinopolymorphaceae bacterium]
MTGHSSPRRRRFLATGVGLAALAAGGWALDRVRLLGGGPDPAPKPTTAPGGATATVTRRSLAATTSFSGTLGYAGTYVVVNQLTGIVTALPPVGRVVRRGEVLYRVDGEPVILLYGAEPAHRDLAAGDDADDVAGTDVRQLEQNLVALGYATTKQLDPESGEFGWRTTRAVKKLQRALGLPRTGKLELGRVVFAPRPLRITEVEGIRGAPAAPGSTILRATSTTRQARVALKATQQGALEVGDEVTITLPDGRATPGKVASVGKVASTPESEQESPTVDVTILPTDQEATGTFDQAPVDVKVVTDRIDDALVVPIEALLALAGNRYAVEVVTKSGRTRRVEVSLGLFDEDAGVVQVTGTTLRAGQRVVVPST